MPTCLVKCNYIFGKMVEKKVIGSCDTAQLDFMRVSVQEASSEEAGKTNLNKGELKNKGSVYFLLKPLIHLAILFVNIQYRFMGTRASPSCHWYTLLTITVAQMTVINLKS